MARRRQFIVYSKCACSVVLEQRQQVIAVVVREIWRSEVRQQLIWVGQLREQLWKQDSKESVLIT